MVGNGMVGKTSLITRFATGRMTDGYKKTIGTDFMEKAMTLHSTGEEVRLMLWDTAGQEMFSRLTRSYYKGSGAVVFVFSTTDRESFLELPRWQAKVREEVGDIVSVLVQNKIDLHHMAAVTTTEAEDMARNLGLRLYRCSVKDGVLVEEVFQDICQAYVQGGGGGSAMSGDNVTLISELAVRDEDQQPGGRRRDSQGVIGGEEGLGEEGGGTHNSTASADLHKASLAMEEDQVAGISAGAEGATGEQRLEGTEKSAEGTDSADGGGSAGKKRRKPQRGDGRVSGAFQLTPLTVRTNGKKRNPIQQLCTIL